MRPDYAALDLADEGGVHAVDFGDLLLHHPAPQHGFDFGNIGISEFRVRAIFTPRFWNGPPLLVFAGAKTHYYVFESEVQARELIGTDEDGNLAPTFDQPITVPKLVTMRQAKLALLQVGMLDAVDTAIATIEDDTERKKAQLEWEYAQEVERGWPTMLAVTSAMGR